MLQQFYRLHIFIVSTIILFMSAEGLFSDISFAQESSEIAEITVKSGELKYYNAPVNKSLQGIQLKLHEGVLQLYETTDGHEILVNSQLKLGNPAQLAWILDGRTEPGTTRNYVLKVVHPDQADAPGKPGIFVEDDGNSLLFTMADKPVLNYRYTEMDVPDGVDEIFKRGGYIHPIWSPGGEVLSRI